MVLVIYTLQFLVTAEVRLGLGEGEVRGRPSYARLPSSESRIRIVDRRHLASPDASSS